MKIKFKDNSELEIQDLQCLIGGTGREPYDSFIINEDTIDKLGLENIKKMITEDNISSVIYLRDDGKAIGKSYVFIHSIYHTFTDTTNLIRVSLLFSDPHFEKKGNTDDLSI